MSEFRRRQSGAFALRPDMPVECLPTNSVYEASRMMIEQKTYCIIVKDPRSPGIGLITAKDLAFRAVASDRDPYQTQVKDIMTLKPLVSHVDNPHEALRLMVKRKVRHLPLIDDSENVVGMLNITKCSYEAMIRLERDSMEAEKLQTTFEEIQIDGDSSESRFTLVNRDDGDDNILQQKRKLYDDLYNDFRKLIELMEQPSLRDVLNDASLDIVPPVYIDAKTTVLQASQILREKKTTALLIVESGSTEPIGIFTSKDIVFRVLATKINPATTSVARVMTSSPNFAMEDMGIHSALRMMYEGNYMNLPIKSKENTVVGLISVLQLTYALLRHLDRDFYANLLTDHEVLYDVDPLDRQSETTSVAWDHFWSLDRRRNSSFTSLESPRLRRLSSRRNSAAMFSPHRPQSSTTSHDGDFDERTLLKNKYKSIPSTILSSRYVPDVGSESSNSVDVGVHFTPKMKSKISFPTSVLSDLSVYERTFKIRTDDCKVYKFRLRNHGMDILQQLNLQIESKLGIENFEDFYLSYIDEDGDDVIIRKEEDLIAALEVSASQTVHLRLHLSDWSPSDGIVGMLAKLDLKKVGLVGGMVFGTLFLLCTGVVVGMNVRHR